MLRSFAIITLAVGLLTGCASLGSGIVPEYEQRLTRTLPNQRDVTFSDEVVYPGKVLCGAYTTTTAQGFSRKTSRFIVGPDFVRNKPTQDEKLVYCSRDPQTAFYTLTGIGAQDDDWTALTKVRDDLTNIDASILAYYNANATLPRKLDDMLGADYGLESSQIIDPWDQPYIYQGGLSGRTTPQYTLKTLGADAKTGGRDANADISYKQAPLLNHVLGLMDK